MPRDCRSVSGANQRPKEPQLEGGDIHRRSAPPEFRATKVHVAVTDSTRCASETLDFIRRSAKSQEAPA